MSTLLTRRLLTASRQTTRIFHRCQSTLDSNPDIYLFKSPTDPSKTFLTLLKTQPPTESLILGSTTTLPPDPYAFRENPRFLSVLHSVIAEHAHLDPQVQGQAASMASAGGAPLFQAQYKQTGRRNASGSWDVASGGGGGASNQGGAGSGGRGGWVHVSDNRHPPDFGRIAEPEDIFGSVEVDGQGKFVDGHGRYQVSGTYRLVTKEGVLMLPGYLMGKLRERLEVEEVAERNRK